MATLTADAWDARIASAPTLTAAGDLLEQAVAAGVDFAEMLRAQEARQRVRIDPDDLQRVLDSLCEQHGRVAVSPPHPATGSVRLFCEDRAAFRFTVDGRLVSDR